MNVNLIALERTFGWPLAAEQMTTSTEPALARAGIFALMAWGVTTSRDN